MNWPWHSRRKRESELEREFRAHLDLEADEQRAAGLSGGAARKAARRVFGNRTLAAEEVRAEWGLAGATQALQDFRYALRGMRKSPGFTAVAVLSLAIGIGANTAVFSVTDAFLLRKLPVPRAEQLTVFRRLGTNGWLYNFSYAWFRRLEAQPDVFSGVSGSWVVDRYEGAGEPQRITVSLVSGNYFSNFGIEAIRGRTLSPDDDRVPGGHPVTVISYGYWARHFGLAADVVGRTVTLHATTFRIAGVAPRGFAGEWAGRPVDLWVPYAMGAQVMPEMQGGTEQFPVVIFGRRKPGVSIERAEAAAAAAFRRIVMEGAGPNPSPERLRFLAERRLELEPAQTGYSEERGAIQLPLRILMALAGAVLLIACANVANLLLARSAARRRELAIRAAIGAGRGRLIRQLLTESAALALAGGTLGILFAIWAARILMNMLAAGTATAPSITLEIHPDLRVFAFTTSISVLTTLLFGLAPALLSATPTLAPGLALRGATAESRHWGKALVVSQVALTLVLLWGAGLFLRTLRNLETQDLGFTREHLLLAWTSPVETGRSGGSLVALLEEIERRVATLPGVRAVSVSNGGVLDGRDGGGPSEETNFDGLPPKPGMLLRFFAITPGFFATTGVTLVSGRAFTASDTENSPPVAVMSEGLARFLYGSANPIGRRFGGRSGRQIEIVGIARNARAGTARDQRGVWYVPYRQSAAVLRLPWCIAVRTEGNAGALAPLVREELRRIDSGLPVFRINTTESQLADVLAGDRMIAALAGLFGAIAAAIACIGLYGVVSYATARRMKEMGVRLAVGATRAGIVRLILIESLSLIAVGLLVGLPLAFACTRLVSSRLFGVSPVDPVTIAAALFLLFAVGGLACFVPAHRSSRVDPMVVLRHD